LRRSIASFELLPDEFHVALLDRYALAPLSVERVIQGARWVGIKATLGNERRKACSGTMPSITRPILGPLNLLQNSF
jgi:hypothetical protein